MLYELQWRVLTGKMHVDANGAASVAVRSESFLIEQGNAIEIVNGEKIVIDEAKTVKDLELFYHASPARQDPKDEVHLWVVPCNVFYPPGPPQLPGAFLSFAFFFPFSAFFDG